MADFQRNSAIFRLQNMFVAMGSVSSSDLRFKSKLHLTSVNEFKLQFLTKYMNLDSSQMSKKIFWSVFALGFVVCVVYLSERNNYYFHRAKHYNMPAGSMLPTLEVGDQFLVKRVFSVFGERYVPNRGDVVVFWNERTGSDYVKRLVGLPGETIQVRDGIVFIDKVAVSRTGGGAYEAKNDSYARHSFTRFNETLPNAVEYEILELSDEAQLDNTKEFVVPDGHLFVLGDNRDNSVDSRVPSVVGFVPIKDVNGVARHVYYSGPEKSFIWRRIGDGRH
nr:signal peptidase I [uncultured Roseibium sp.]